MSDPTSQEPHDGSCDAGCAVTSRWRGCRKSIASKSLRSHHHPGFPCQLTYAQPENYPGGVREAESIKIPWGPQRLACNLKIAGGSPEPRKVTANPPPRSSHAESRAGPESARGFSSVGR